MMCVPAYGQSSGDFLHVFTLLIEVQHLFNLLSHPSFFLSQLSPLLLPPRGTVGSHHCLASGCTWELVQGMDLESRESYKAALELGARSRKLTARSRHVPLALPAEVTTCPCLILGWQGLAVPALPPQA